MRVSLCIKTMVKARAGAAELSGNVFRFQTVRISSGDLQRMHGTDERIAVRDYEQAIRVYRQVILEAAS